MAEEVHWPLKQKRCIREHVSNRTLWQTPRRGASLRAQYRLGPIRQTQRAYGAIVSTQELGPSDRHIKQNHISEHRKTDLGPSTQKIDLTGRHTDEALYCSTDLGQSDRHRKHVVH